MGKAANSSAPGDGSYCQTSWATKNAWGSKRSKESCHEKEKWSCVCVCVWWLKEKGRDDTLQNRTGCYLKTAWIASLTHCNTLHSNSTYIKYNSSTDNFVFPRRPLEVSESESHVSLSMETLEVGSPDIPPTQLHIHAVKVVVCNNFLLYLLKLLLWSDSRIPYRSTVKKIPCLWLHPVAVIWFARIHRSWINTTNQSQEECLRRVNHARAYAAGLPHTTLTRQCPSTTQCLLSPGQIGSSCKQWRETDNNNRAGKCPTIAHVKEKK